MMRSIASMIAGPNPEPLIDKLYRRLRLYRVRMLEMKMRWRAREAFLAHRSTADQERCNEVMEELAKLRLVHGRLLNEEVKQRRRAVAAMAVNVLWLDAYHKQRDQVTDEAGMNQLVAAWGSAATQGKKLDQIRVTEDDMAAPSVLTDLVGLLPGFRPANFAGMSARGRATWLEAHQDRELTYWRPDEKLDWYDPLGSGSPLPLHGERR